MWPYQTRPHLSWPSLIDALTQSSKSRLCGQVEFCMQSVKLHFNSAEPRANVGCDLLAKVPSTHGCTDQQPHECT